MQVKDVIAAVDRLAPFDLAEPWDHVGLQVGSPGDELPPAGTAARRAERRQARRAQREPRPSSSSPSRWTTPCSTRPGASAPRSSSATTR